MIHRPRALNRPRALIGSLATRIALLICVPLVCVALAACNAPPPNEYVGGAPGAGALDLGKNTVHEACSLQRNGSDAQVYCGSYLEPAGRIITPAQPADPVAFLTSGPWRTAFDSQFLCSAPVQTTVLDNPGATMACTRRQGGWQHVVVAARIDGKLYIADGAKPTEAVLPRAIGVFAGKLAAVPAAATDTGLTTEREAAQAINVQGAGAIIEVNRQMARGAAENRKGNYAAAEIAYRTAISIQERAVGADNPALAVPLAREALQLSNQGRYAEADQLFARAQRLQTLPGQIDPVAKPMVTEMRALDLLNRDKPQQALDLLNQAEPQFAALVPPEDLTAQVAPDTGVHSSVQRMAQAAEVISLMANQAASDALNGLIETKRYRAIALNELGRTQEAAESLQAAETLFAGRVPRLAARYYRTVGMTVPGRAGSAQALSSLGLAVDKFALGQPGTAPMAKTQLLRAADFAVRGNYTDALDDCRSAAATLETLQRGVEPDLLMPCLHALSTEITKGGQPVLREMFALAQMAQGSITSQQIALAAARLAAGSRDPKVAEAINAYDTATARVELLYRKRLDAAAEKNNNAAVAAIDDDIKKALAAQREAGQVRQEASPGFAALVQESVSAQDVQSLLLPSEAVAVIVLGQNEGWTLLIRKDGITAGRVDGGASRIDPLVKKFRASMELGNDNRPAPFNTAAAQGIYDAVLGPVHDAMKGVDALTVAPSGTLLAVPFGALLTAPASGDDLARAPFLIRQTTISHVPSAASFVNLRKSAKTVQATQPWFGMGDFHAPTMKQALATFPVATCGESARELASLPPLPGAQRELEVARRLLNAPASDQLLGAAFTTRNVLAAPLKNFRILHFATHAVLPGELKCQVEPAILTTTPPNAPNASEATLTASQIQQMDLDAELVILAACNTGGENGSGAGESLSGLARSFFFAGARSLLVTHWDANDATTTYLTALFLQALQANPSAGPAAALAVSQRRMLDESTGTRSVQAHPYYWAVEALIGGRGAAATATVAAAANKPAGG